MVDEKAKAARKNGFTLLEGVLALLVVGGVAWFSMPKIRETKIDKNERSAVFTLRLLMVEELTKRAGDMKSTSLAVERQNLMSSPEAKSLLPLPPLPFERNGYRFEFLGEAQASPKFSATPMLPGRTGRRFFLSELFGSGSNWYARSVPVNAGKTGGRPFFDWTGVIRFHVSRPATSADSAIE